jgi:hypothetical protein
MSRCPAMRKHAAIGLPDWATEWQSGRAGSGIGTGVACVPPVGGPPALVEFGSARPC